MPPRQDRKEQERKNRETLIRIKNELRRLDRMSSLAPEQFAFQNGMADELAGALKGVLNPNQLRKVFGEVKRIRRKVEKETITEANRGDAFNVVDMVRLMPNLAYAYGRDLLPKDFYEVLTICFDRGRLHTKADYLRAADFVEAVMAYHKYHSKS